MCSNKTRTLLVLKPQVGLVSLVDSCWGPVLLRGCAVPGPGEFMPAWGERQQHTGLLHVVLRVLQNIVRQRLYNTYHD
jgi:hypothetical protein